MKKKNAVGFFDPFKDFDADFTLPRIFGSRLPSLNLSASWGRMPVVDSFETNSEVVVTAELPGVAKENIEVHLTDKGLSLKVTEKEKSESEKKEKGFYRFESSSRFNGFHQFIPFSSPVDSAHAKSSFKNGVLEVRVPKREAKESGRLLKIG